MRAGGWARLALLVLLTASVAGCDRPAEDGPVPTAEEQRAQPDAFSSIPAAMWWAIATLTTVGYGDIVPVTVAGRLAGAMVAVLGVGVFALPTAILGAAFMEEMAHRGGEADSVPGPTCPHCGSRLQVPAEAEIPDRPGGS